jgi:hypothetical protein
MRAGRVRDDAGCGPGLARWFYGAGVSGSAGRHHRRGFPGHLGAGAHRDPDVGLLHGRRVVDAVPEHRHDLALLPQDVDQAHFVLGVTWAITPMSSIPASASSPVMPPNSAPVITISIACAPLCWQPVVAVRARSSMNRTARRAPTRRGRSAAGRRRGAEVPS